MKSRCAIFALVPVLLCVSLETLHAQSGDASIIRSRIIALENVWNQAETTRDVRALDSLFDNELVYVNPDGTLLSKSEVLAHVKSDPIHTVVTESMSVQVFGSTAIATGTYVSRDSHGGKPVVDRGRFIDTWILKNNAWVCIAAQATPIIH
jgi:hypothetical protein